MQSKNIAKDAATMPALDFTDRHTLSIGSVVGNLTRADFKRLDKVLKDLPTEQRAAILIVVADCVAQANGDGYIEYQPSHAARAAHTAMKMVESQPEGWSQGRCFLSAESLSISLTWMLNGTLSCDIR